MTPPRSAFTTAERRVIDAHRTPRQVQRYLNQLEYNTDPVPSRPTLRAFRRVVRLQRAHCLEAALSAAVILEQHGYPPLLLSIESIDELDHVLFVFRHKGRWGSIGRSRDPGLHGRTATFSTLRQLALSYFEPFVDATGCVKAYGPADLRLLGSYDWRFSARNVWKVERFLYEVPHRAISSSQRRVDRLRRRYFAYVGANPGRKPMYYDRSRWTDLPKGF